jgi:hypothetical protein
MKLQIIFETELLPGQREIIIHIIIRWKQLPAETLLVVNSQYCAHMETSLPWSATALLAYVLRLSAF